jgi:hypothetical protein
MLKQIQDGYDLVFRSPQTGRATLYRRKNWNGQTGHAQVDLGSPQPGQSSPAQLNAVTK